jgi:acetyltransferase
VIASALAQSSGWMPPESAADLLNCYGIPLVESRIAVTPGDAAGAARDLGGAVALRRLPRAYCTRPTPRGQAWPETVGR